MMKYLLFIFATFACLVSCSEKKVIPEGFSINNPPITAYVNTISHDGHMFVAITGRTTQGGASIIHHPDCPCGKISK